MRGPLCCVGGPSLWSPFSTIPRRMVDRLVTTKVIKPATTAIDVSGMNWILPMKASTNMSKYKPANFARCFDAVSLALSRIKSSLNLASDSALSFPLYSPLSFFELKCRLYINVPFTVHHWFISHNISSQYIVCRIP